MTGQLDVFDNSVYNPIVVRLVKCGSLKGGRNARQRKKRIRAGGVRPYCIYDPSLDRCRRRLSG